MKLSTRSVARSYPAWTAHSGVPVDDIPLGIEALDAVSGTNALAARSIKNNNARYEAPAADMVAYGECGNFIRLVRPWSVSMLQGYELSCRALSEQRYSK